VRGSTALAEKIGPGEFARLLNRFYEVSTEVLAPRGAIIDKMIGDEIMAFFLPAFHSQLFDVAVETATEILRAVGYGSEEGSWLPVGIGIHHGEAYVGKVGTEDVSDFTALGDTINTGARLQAFAQGGQIAVSDSVYDKVSAIYPDVPGEAKEIRGRPEELTVHVISPFE